MRQAPNKNNLMEMKDNDEIEDKRLIPSNVLILLASPGADPKTQSSPTTMTTLNLFKE